MTFIRSFVILSTFTLGMILSGWLDGNQSFAICAWQGKSSDSTGSDFQSLFDGETLAGWSGKEGLWRVEGGVIVGETTAENMISRNEFLVWDGEETGDFILKAMFRVSGSKSANSGIQFRSERTPDGSMKGYQADIEISGRYMGILYSEGTGRGILCERGDQVTFDANGQSVVEKINDREALLKHIELDGWNLMQVEARGNHLVVKINDQVTAEVIDGHPQFAATGWIGLQLHTGPPMKIEFKDIFLKKLAAERPAD